MKISPLWLTVTRRCLRVASLAVCFPLLCFEALADSNLILVNPNQADGIYPVCIRTSLFDGIPDGSLALQAGGKSYPADRILLDEACIVALVPLAPLACVPVTVGAGVPSAPINVVETPSAITVTTDAGAFTFGKTNGLSAIGFRDLQMPVRISGKGEPYKVSFRGTVCAIVESPSRRYLVWRNGRIRLFAKDALSLSRPYDGAELYMCKHGWGFRGNPLTGKHKWIVRSQPNNVVSPHEWVQYFDEDKKIGFWIHNACWGAQDTLDVKPGIANYGLHPKSKQLVLDLAPITSAEGGEEAYRQSYPVLGFAQGKAEIESFNGERYRVETVGGKPDLKAGKLAFYQGDRRTSMLEFHGQYFLVYLPVSTNQPLTEADLTTPAMLFEDWNRDGKFFDGPLFWGGFLQQDRYFSGRPDGRETYDPFLGRQWSGLNVAWDLDGDGDSDVMQSGDQFYFDLEDRPIGASVTFNPVQSPYLVSGNEPAWQVGQRGTGVGWGSGGMRRSYEGHYTEEGESQLSFNFDERTRAPEAKLRMTGENWANRHDLVGLRWNRFCMANLDRKTDEELDYSYNWDIQFQTGREIQDYNDTGDCFRYCNMFTLKDPWGHELKLRIWEVPPDWDGKKITWRYLSEHKTWELHSHAPWKGIAVHWYPKLLGIFEAEGAVGEPADEGMEPWALGYVMARRWEVRLKPKPHGEPITIYYSPLMGAFHFKGAAFSHVNAPASWSGTTIDWAVKSKIRDDPILPFNVGNILNGDLYGDPYRLRVWGGQFLCAWDMDGDDYFDTYLYDETNDGITDRVLSYSPQTKLLQLVHAGGLSAWLQPVEFVEKPFLLGKYEEISKLYLEGYKHEPMVAAIKIDNGQPSYEDVSPPFYVSLSKEWLPVAAVDEYHGQKGAFNWTDFSAGGLVRLGGELSQRRMALTAVTQPYTPQLLDGLALIVIGRFDRMLSQAEANALDAWLKKGGRLLVLNASEQEDERVLLNELIGRYGAKFTNQVLEKRTHRWRQPHYGENSIRDLRFPAEWNRVTHFAGSTREMLEGVSYLSFVGSILETAVAATPLLAYDKAPIVAEVKVGQGAILVSGASFCINKYHCFAPFNDGMYVENYLVLRRIVDRLMAGIATPEVSALQTTAATAKIEVRGLGGGIQVPLWSATMAVKVNGKAVELTKARAAVFQAGSGKNLIEISK